MSTTPSASSTAAEVRAALARLDMTQTELAAVTERSQGYWSKRLSGRIALNVTDLALISRLTGVSIADLTRAA